MADLLHIQNKYYYIDIEAMSNFVNIPKEDVKELYEAIRENDLEETPFNPSMMINGAKYDMVKTMIDVLFNMGFPLRDEADDMDPTEKLIKGYSSPSDDGLSSMPVPFKMAFNTLSINKILKTYEPTNRKNKRVNPEA